MMPVIMALLVGALGSAIGAFTFRVVAALGMGYITYSGLDLLIDLAKVQVGQLLALMPANAIALAGVLKIGVCVNIMFSALVIKMPLMGFYNGVFKRWTLLGQPGGPT